MSRFPAGQESESPVFRSLRVHAFEDALSETVLPIRWKEYCGMYFLCLHMSVASEN
jgi:hypothetical protein